METSENQRAVKRARRFIGLQKADRWLTEDRSGEGSDLPGEPHHRERVAAVRLHVYVEDHVAVDRAQIGPEGVFAVRAQDLDAVCVTPQVELPGRAEHAVADHPPDLRPRDPPITGECGAWECDGNELPGRDVLRAADDLQGLAAFLGEDLGDPKRVRIRMPPDLEEPPDDHVAPLGAAHLHGGHLHAANGELFAQLSGAQLDVDVIAEPGEGDSHLIAPR